MHNQISITKIQNGYIVSTPIYPNYRAPLPYGGTKEEINGAGKSYIPAYKNVSFFETLDKVFEFLKSIESNLSIEEYAYGGICHLLMQ